MNLFRIILFILVLIPASLFAQTCSKDGYTIVTINGIFTDEFGAQNNLDSLKYKFGDNYKNQIVDFQYLYNPSHIAGLGDIAKAIYQGIFDSETVEDYDLVEMIKDASEKVTTQKMLVVAHSQGNFYANSFYDVVTEDGGGVSPKSIGVYGVATPSGRVAGNGKWLTSDTDEIIATLVGKKLARKIMSPNTHIELKVEDGNGHSFSDVYLKYKSGQILSDINTSLAKLEIDPNKDANSSCITDPKVSANHKITGVLFAIIDPIANTTKTIALGVYNGAENLAQIIKNLGVKNTATAGIAFENNNVIPIEKSSTNTTNTSKPKTIENIPKEKTPDIKIVETKVTENKIAQVTLPPAIVLPGGGKSAKAEDSPPSEDVVPEVEPPEESTENPPEEETDVPDTIAPEIILNGENEIIITRDSEYIELGATAIDDVDDTVTVVAEGVVDVTIVGTYTVTYTATDIAGNSASETRNIKVVSYIYIPKYDFGTENGDGNDWQAWIFNGSYVYDWVNSYTDGYLNQTFKMQIMKTGSFWCSSCLQMGVFNHNPKLGFERSDLLYYARPENSPQNNGNGVLYTFVMEWDDSGYNYSISSDSTETVAGHVDISGLTKNSWLGWDTEYNEFRTFPFGNWAGQNPHVEVFTGGTEMILTPQRIYKPTLL